MHERRTIEKGLGKDPLTWNIERLKASSPIRNLRGEDSNRKLESSSESLATNTLSADTDLNEWCGDKTSGQRMWFTENKCSLASFNMTYLDSNNNVRQAKEGEVIAMECDGVLCPQPAVPDCYETPGICSSDQFCMLNQQEVWWTAAGIGGNTALTQFGFCSEFKAASPEEYYQQLLSTTFHGSSNSTVLTLEQATALYNSGVERCGGSDGFASGYAIKDLSGLKTWKGARGRCVTYRKLGESCISEFVDVLDDGSGTGMLPKMMNGKQYKRPLLCGKGLKCTGSDFDVLPSTCVEERPADVCYQVRTLPRIILVSIASNKRLISTLFCLPLLPYPFLRVRGGTRRCVRAK